jgi:hypothetical protein
MEFKLILVVGGDEALKKHWSSLGVVDGIPVIFLGCLKMLAYPRRWMNLRYQTMTRWRYNGNI